MKNVTSIFFLKFAKKLKTIRVKIAGQLLVYSVSFKSVFRRFMPDGNEFFGGKLQIKLNFIVWKSISIARVLSLVLDRRRNEHGHWKWTVPASWALHLVSGEIKCVDLRLR
jgi:hypothetical protein